MTQGWAIALLAVFGVFVGFMCFGIACDIYPGDPKPPALKAGFAVSALCLAPALVYLFGRAILG